MVYMVISSTLWSLPLPNVTWHSGTWPYTMTYSIAQTSHQFANVLPNWTLLPILTLLPNFGGFHRTLQRVRQANRGRLLLRTPGPVQFGTCMCSNVETILSWTCHVYGPFEFLTSLGTSILLRIAGDIYFHSEFFAPSPFQTGQRSRCKWNQACPFTWSHSCFRPQIRLIILGFVYSYLQYSFNVTA